MTLRYVYVDYYLLKDKKEKVEKKQFIFLYFNQTSTMHVKLSNMLSTISRNFKGYICTSVNGKKSIG